MRVEIVDEAEQELLDEAAYLDERRSGYGDRFLAAAAYSVGLIVEHPQIGRKERGVRVKRILGFPHSIMYLVRKDSIKIVAFAHGKRRPGYWRHRLRK